MFRFLNLKAYIKNNSRWLTINIISALIGNGSLLAAPFFIGNAISYMSSPGEVNFSGIIEQLTITAVLYVIGCIFVWLSYVASHQFTIRIISDMRAQIIQKITRASIPSIDQLKSGDVMMRMSQNADMLYDAISYFLLYFVPGVVTVIAGITMLAILNYWFAILVVLFVPVLYIYTRKATEKTQDRFVKIQHQTAFLSSYAEELFSKQKILIAYNQQKTTSNYFKHYQDDLTEISTKAYFVSSINNPTFRLITNINYVCLGILFAVFYFLNQSVDVGVFASILIYAAMFFRPFNELSNFTQQFLLGSTSYDLLENLIHSIDEEKLGALHIEKPIEGQFDIKNVVFSYDEGEPLLTNFNLTVKKGSKIGIVGPTGAGKTTFINLLMRFYDIKDGVILLDQKNMRNYDQTQLRKHFGLILQEPWLFSGTIFENIAYGKPEATYQEVVDAATQAGCHDFITQLNQGYDTIYEDASLSEGIEQLITIARAILLNPSVLILDEATSHIDSLMESRIQKAFIKLMAGKTAFVIAHRLKVVEDFDELIVLDQGHIIEQGTHDELMAKKGFYYKLYMSQYQA